MATNKGEGVAGAAPSLCDVGKNAASIEALRL